ncbi:MAG: nicotinamide mononucleotide transporter [Bacteroidetes bacterium]|nr:nicotinamide mononucleotide transporter [Bacteroidota bacterium]
MLLMNLSNCLHDSVLFMTIPEIIAVATGIFSVWFAKKENILVYPIGIISVLLYVYICLEVKLYADAAINAYYFVVSIYGWYYWKNGKTEGISKNKIEQNQFDQVFTIEQDIPFSGKKAAISWNKKEENLYYALGTIFLAVFLGYMLNEFTDSNVPYWDGGTTAIFCMAMILMALKKIENWIYWIIGDVICIPLFFSKGLCLSSFQYLIFTVIAIAGLMAWMKKYNHLKTTS